MSQRSHSDPLVWSLHGPRRQPANDLYGLQGKLADPTACPRCGALYRDGRRTWGSPPLDAAPVECPACRRMADDFPAGIPSVRGEFVRSHRREIESRLRHVEERNRAEHPPQRIMAIESADDGGLTVTTTDDPGPVRIEWFRDRR